MPEASLESARNRVGKSFSFICFLVDRLQERLCFSQPDQHINIYNQLFLAQKTCYRLWKQGAYALPHRSLWELVCVSNFGEQINESWEPQGQVASQYCLAHWLGSVLIIFLLFIMLAKYEHVSPILCLHLLKCPLPWLLCSQLPFLILLEASAVFQGRGRQNEQGLTCSTQA